MKTAQKIIRSATVLKSRIGRIEEIIKLTSAEIIKHGMSEDQFIELLTDLGKGGCGLLSNEIDEIAYNVEKETGVCFSNNIY